MAIGLGLPGLGLHVPLNLPASAHALPQGGLSSGPSPVIHLYGWPWSRLGPVWALPPDPDPRGAQQQGQESLGPLQAPSGQHWGGEGGGQGDEHAGLGITPPGVHLLCHLLSVSFRQVTNLFESQLSHRKMRKTPPFLLQTSVSAPSPAKIGHMSLAPPCLCS